MRLLIVDSISSLITPILGGSGSHGKDYNISQFPGILGNYIFFKKKNKILEKPFYYTKYCVP